MSQQNVIRESFIAWHQEKYPGRPVVLDPVWAEYCESVVVSGIPELQVFPPARPMDEVKLIIKGADAERATGLSLRRDRDRILSSVVALTQSVFAYSKSGVALADLLDAATAAYNITQEDRP